MTIRMKKIVDYLKGGDLVQAQWLANKLDVSVSSIFRDVDALRGEGLRIDTARGPGGGIALRPKKRP